MPGPITPAGCASSSACCGRKLPSRSARPLPSAKQSATPVYTESGQKLTFACASEWPGWCRSGKGEEAALQALVAYAPRFRPVAKRAKLPFDAETAMELRVVERVKGSANTDFGVPHEVAKLDSRPVSAPDGQRLAALVNAAWATFDEVAASAPAELRKGPRGGGRDRDKMIDHVLGADEMYARKLGLRLKVPSRDDRAAIRAFRAAVIEALRRPSKGGPLVDKGWPQRYAARRIAWHALDHAWEMQDRSETGAP